MIFPEMPTIRLVCWRCVKKLNERLLAMPDLSLFPENVLYDEAMGDPVAFGEKNRERIASALDVANLMLKPIGEAEGPLRSAFSICRSSNFASGH